MEDRRRYNPDSAFEALQVPGIAVAAGIEAVAVDTGTVDTEAVADGCRQGSSFCQL